MPKTRTFIAIEATDEVHARAIQAIEELRHSAADVKWVAPENLHWTIQFLGDVTNEVMATVCRLTTKIAATHEPFALSARGVGAFPKPERPRTLWMGADTGVEQLCSLQSELEEALCDLGFRPEHRRYVPHLTLGRIGRTSHASPAIAGQLAELADFNGGAMSVDRVTVFGSMLEREGPVYHVLAQCPLGAN